MNRVLLFGILAGTAAWILAIGGLKSSPKKVSVEDAAAKLQQAWADHHTTA